MAEQLKSLAELQGWTYSKRVESSYERLKEFIEKQRQDEAAWLQEEAAKAEERLKDIPEDMSEAGKKLLREMTTQSAQHSVDGIDQLLEVSLKGAIGVLQPIFGEGAVEAAVDRIRKEFS